MARDAAFLETLVELRERYEAAQSALRLLVDSARWQEMSEYLYLVIRKHLYGNMVRADGQRPQIPSSSHVNPRVE